MNKRDFALMAILCGCFAVMSSVNLQADSTFAVSSFIPERFVDFQWRLDGHAGAQGYYNSNRSTAGSYEMSAIASSDAQSMSLTSGSEYRYRTIPRYLTWTIKGGFGLDHTRYQSSGANSWDSHKYNQTSLSPRLTQTVEAGKYLTSDFFLAATLTTAWSYTQNRGRTLRLFYDGPIIVDEFEQAAAKAAGDDQGGDDKSYSISVGLLPGWGRVYEGQFAATALYLIAELKKNGILKREPTYQEMMELTEIIYQYRLKHAIDSRLHKIEALSSVMTFLAEKEITDDLGPHGYLLVQDVWDYFPRSDRRFGWQVKGGPGIDYNYRSSQEHNAYIAFDYDSYYRHSTSEARSPYLQAKADYFRPLGLRWQVDLTSSARYYLDPSTLSKTTEIIYPSSDVTYFREELNRWAYYTVALEGAIRYILDSRTSALFRPAYQLTHAHFSDLDERRTDDWGIWNETRLNRFEGQLILAGSMEYRISIPTTLRVNAQYRHYDRDETARESSADVMNSSYDLSVDIVHYLY